jgi:hypothetical protein
LNSLKVDGDFLMRQRSVGLFAIFISFLILVAGCSLPGWDIPTKKQSVEEAPPASSLDLSGILVGAWEEWSDASGGSVGYLYAFYQDGSVIMSHKETDEIVLTGTYTFLGKDSFTVRWALPQSSLTFQDVLWKVISIKTNEINFDLNNGTTLTLRHISEEKPPLTPPAPPATPPSNPQSPSGKISTPPPPVQPPSDSQTPPSQATPPPSPPTDSGNPSEIVQINEVELNPGCVDQQSSCMESVELYNATDMDIQVGGWQLISSHGMGAVVPGDVVLKSKGFYVLQQKSWLNNVDEFLLLKNPSGLVVDQTPTQTDDHNQDNAMTWQRCPDGSVNWLLRPGTLGSTNAC